jgi:hypothetical protein
LLQRGVPLRAHEGDSGKGRLRLSWVLGNEVLRPDGSFRTLTRRAIACTAEPTSCDIGVGMRNVSTQPRRAVAVSSTPGPVDALVRPAGRRQPSSNM